MSAVAHTVAGLTSHGTGLAMVGIVQATSARVVLAGVGVLTAGAPTLRLARRVGGR